MPLKRMEDYLPKRIGNVSQEIHRGRNVYDGYQRAAGLQMTDLRKKIDQDPVYQEAVELSADRSIIEPTNRYNLYLLARFYLQRIPRGHIVEFGSYRGGGAIFLAAVARSVLPGVKVYGLDTFEGMPPTDNTRDAHHAGDFKDTSFEELNERVEELGLSNLEFRKGLFQDTARQVLNEAGSVALAHIDCDIYSAVAYSYATVRDYMVDGGYLVFDDAMASTSLGATEAVEDLAIRRDGLNSEQVFPHFVFRSWDSKPSA